MTSLNYLEIAADTTACYAAKAARSESAEIAAYAAKIAHRAKMRYLRARFVAEIIVAAKARGAY